jgi:hypothetical protein
MLGLYRVEIEAEDVLNAALRRAKTCSHDRMGCLDGGDAESLAALNVVQAC